MLSQQILYPTVEYHVPVAGLLRPQMSDNHTIIITADYKGNSIESMGCKNVPIGLIIPLKEFK
ncbi:MAG TPA: hypothetical protein VFJ51_03680 [Nitrososphaeraceae archaeon]|nr:hypothetical protein [Nitrososphaeraceae archaeon]